VSAQTGAAPPSGPASSRLVDRARFRVGRFQDEPNPIWIRELRQAARLGRTPVIVMVLTVLMTLLIASIGGIASTEMSPASTGVLLFQVFFSVAYFVVTLAGPAVAANTIASEREGRTWEAVILTGLSPGTVARGKFLAAYTAVGMYVVALAPVGALPFLFGGITATEVVVAFVFLFLIALLAVAFGLAISSKMASLRAAIVVTLLLTFPITSIAFSSFGVGLSYAAHYAWPGIPEGQPIWLPAAYERAGVDAGYVVFLFALPIAAVTLPAWFLYEVTIANLTSVTDDRSTGLKRWFLVAAPIFTLASAVPIFAVRASERSNAALGGLCALVVFFTFCVFLFAGDPIGPSRRVKKQWDEAGAGAVRRFLGPGVMRSAMLLLWSGLFGYGALTAIALAAIHFDGTAAPATASLEVVSFAAYSALFYVFLVGLGAFLRSRTATPLVARLLLLTLLFAIAVGPWIVAAMTGMITERGEDALLVGSPSPIFAFVMFGAARAPSPDTKLTAGFACCLGWAVVGLCLLDMARRRCAGIIRRHEEVLAESDRILAAEDEAAAEAAARGTEEPAGEPA
jgi:ABC-type transport system involved in multi-copper enzyme maturation permease subunit